MGRELKRVVLDFKYRTGRSAGPSCGAIKCNEFIMSPLNAMTVALAEAKIAELRQRLQAA